MNGNNLICVPGYMGGYDLEVCSASARRFIEREDAVFVEYVNDRVRRVVNMAVLPAYSVVDCAAVWLFNFGHPFPYHKVGREL